MTMKRGADSKGAAGCALTQDFLEENDLAVGSGVEAAQN